ncbi:MAG: ATP-binding cassette domain-containing protein [Paracoccaceae bacterium]|jgi:ABC-2 type transport system ATP-binding protein|nr:ATP-binding cassette domain-containing protein [Paracoccaceae bacterium]MDG1736964.1 ATP-binding cassette domain-containing protein [Paracoccaceae bacterium]MDG2258228.1 ATP-binding cassette domain-containing protein [Paracoccaceae bacterium]
MNEPEKILSLAGVSKSYGKINALHDVSFDLSAGQFVGLLGPNGAGKSTLFQIISGLFAPDEGAVTVFGQNYANDPAEILRRLGVVFQERSVDLDMTIKENLSFHGRLFGLSGKRLKDRIAEQTDRFGFADMQDRRVRQLSGGQQRKVEIARALLNRPGLLIMDEPTAGLDAPSRRALVQDIRDLATESQVAILWATHLVDEVEYADRVILIRDGQVVADSTPNELKDMAGTADLTDAYAALAGTSENG